MSGNPGGISGSDWRGLRSLRSGEIEHDSHFAAVLVQFRSGESRDRVLARREFHGRSQDNEAFVRHDGAQSRELIENVATPRGVEHHGIRRIEEHDVDGLRRSIDGERPEGVTLECRYAIAAVERCNVPLEVSKHLAIALDTDDLSGTAGSSLKAHGPDAREQVEHPRAVEPSAEQIEQRLLDARRHGSRAVLAFRGIEQPGPVFAALNPDHRGIVREARAASGSLADGPGFK